MTDKEYLFWIKSLKDLKLSKDTWHVLDDKTRHDILEKIREVNDYSVIYRRNRKLSRHKDIDPYGEENWD
jgi:hypothetical protein